MQIRRTLARIVSGVTLLGLVVSYIEILSNAPQLWYILVLITPIAVFTEICLLSGVNIPIRKNCFLDKDLTDSIVATAVNPVQYPLCRQLTVMHSSGTAIAALIAKAIHTNIKLLRMMITRWQVEMGHQEKAYSLYVLQNHLYFLSRIHANMLSVVTRGNLLAECYRAIPKRRVERIYGAINAVNLKFEEDIIRRIESLRDAIPSDVDRYKEDETWKIAIQKLVNEEVPLQLAEIIRSLDQIEESASALTQDIEADWQRDLPFLWDYNSCKPRAEVVPAKLKCATTPPSLYVDRWLANLKKSVQH